MQYMIQIPLSVILAMGIWPSAVILANILSFVMTNKINQKIPVDERIPPLGSRTNIRQRFRQLYPGNKLILFYDACLVIMLLSFLVVVKFWVFH